ncbi:MAG: hypothetical protein AB8B49_03355 [Nitratireductor sp.]
MFYKIFNRALNLPMVGHLAALAVSIGVFSFSKSKLDASYIASKHPVDYATGQTSFDGETIKGYYEVMQEADTLDVYWQTQFIDFGFILGIFLIGLFLFSFIARFTKALGWARKVSFFGACALMLGAMSDAVENFISFYMLSNAQSFANWVAVPYSAFAVLKFALITTGMFALMLTIVLLVVEKIRAFSAK